MRVTGTFFRYSARDHVGVADRFDLFQLELLCQRIKSRKQGVQEVNDARWRTFAGKGGKIHQIGEQDGRIGKAVGDRNVAFADAAYDRSRQNVQQQRFGLALLDPQLVDESQFAIA